jgi:hypothetical protein
MRIARGRLGGWSRLGIVLTLLWTLIVALELSAEYHFGPWGLGLLTDTVIAKTGEPAAVLRDNAFYDLVPVDQVINIRKLVLTLLAPIVSLWVIGTAWAWVREGFRNQKI